MDTQGLFDTIFFPFRALFIAESDMFGLSSLRTERLKKVAHFCRGRVLDIGCGKENLFIKNYIENKNSIGIDVFGYEGVDNIVKNMEILPFPDESFDTVTLIAVGGHIPKEKRVGEFKEFQRILKPNGRIIFTEGEPITQTIDHKWRLFFYAIQGKVDMDTERGMEKDEQYCMPKKEIYTYLNSGKLKLTEKFKFMWGLNNIYVATKIDKHSG